MYTTCLKTEGSPILSGSGRGVVFFRGTRLVRAIRKKRLCSFTFLVYSFNSFVEGSGIILSEANSWWTVYDFSGVSTREPFASILATYKLLFNNAIPPG